MNSAVGSVGFYRQLGAQIEPDYTICMLEGDNLTALARSASAPDKPATAGVPENGHRGEVEGGWVGSENGAPGDRVVPN